MRRFKRFLTGERGASTVDMVALTAAVVLIGVALVFVIFSNGVAGLVGEINDVGQSF